MNHDLVRLRSESIRQDLGDALKASELALEVKVVRCLDASAYA